MNDLIYTVSQLNKAVKVFLEESDKFRDFFLKGEMSNITYYKSGHLYFTLKDKKASVKCVAFNYKFKRIPENLKEGDAIKLFANVTLYENTGQYQISVAHIEKENKLGSLYEKLEKLKKELSEKGYFDEIYKKEIPKLPLNIGVVTSGTGAAIRDIIDTSKKRYPNINIYIYPAKVQGLKSEIEIQKGIKVLNKIDIIDLIIVGRGGGSIEDLWSFNTIDVVQAIFDSNKPIISAVGHEIDFLLSDLVADKRAATPTQAAEIAIPEKNILIDSLKEKENKLKRVLLKKLEISKIDLNIRVENYYIKNFKNLVKENNNLLVDKMEYLNKLILSTVDKKKKNLILREEKLKSLNPNSILKRGYSITYKNNKVIKNILDLNDGDIIKTKLFDEEFESNIFKKKGENNA